ncbi:MAG: hypothetical protein ABIS28_09535 [Caldimonas sp.]
MELDVRVLRELTLDPATHPRGIGHVSAASGLVRVGDRYCVIADDEQHLAVFDIAGEGPGQLIRLFDGDLPASPKSRKAAKADLEAIAVLPPHVACARGAVLAIGSGSRPQRERAVLIGIDESGALTAKPHPIDLAALYAILRAHLGALNIEGAFACGDEFILLQRGNQRLSNACIRYALDDFVRWCVDPMQPAPRPDSIGLMDLGDAQGVPLTFTDGASVGGGSWVFSAVAERTSDSYVDGACVAAAVGLVGPDRRVCAIRPIRPLWKIEGIAVQPFEGALHLTMTTDADDPSQPSKLLVGTLDLA